MFDKAIPKDAPLPPAQQPQEQPALIVPARSPSVTYALIGINVLVFAAMVLSGQSVVEPAPEAMIAWGADFGPLTLQGHQLWRIFTSIFLHFGIIHVGMNMLVLYQIGPFTERLYGHVRYLMIYLPAGIGGSVVSLYVHPDGVGAGASGAIFGVYGGMLAFLFAHRSIMPATSRSAILRSATIFLGINLIYGLKAEIDLSAHIAGLVIGFVVGTGLVMSGGKKNVV